jgi:hypothetical protein
MNAVQRKLGPAPEEEAHEMVVHIKGRPFSSPVFLLPRPSHHLALIKDPFWLYTDQMRCYKVLLTASLFLGLVHAAPGKPGFFKKLRGPSSSSSGSTNASSHAHLGPEDRDKKAISVIRHPDPSRPYVLLKYGKLDRYGHPVLELPRGSMHAYEASDAAAAREVHEESELSLLASERQEQTRLD